MAFYFPAAHARIDWVHGHAFKNTELRQVVRDAELGKCFADALVQVTLRDGEPHWIYIHIEVQGQRDSDFARRMFTYNYQLFDRYARPIASLAVLADAGPSSDPTTMVSRSLVAAINSNSTSSSSSTMRTASSNLRRAPIPSSWLPSRIYAPVRPKMTRKPAIGPSSTSCVRSTGKVGTGSAY